MVGCIRRPREQLLGIVAWSRPWSAQNSGGRGRISGSGVHALDGARCARTLSHVVQVRRVELYINAVRAFVPRSSPTLIACERRLRIRRPGWLALVHDHIQLPLISWTGRQAVRWLNNIRAGQPVFFLWLESFSVNGMNALSGRPAVRSILLCIIRWDISV